MKNFKSKALCAAALLFALSSTNPISAQSNAKKEIPLKYGATRLDRRQDKDMQKFRENRLGAFVHWGLYAIPGGIWKGKTYSGAAEWLKAWAKVPSDEWMALMKEWNPTKYDPVAWAKMFKDMGVKYVKITTKHHEGFCLWPTKTTKYSVKNTPYKKDILGPLVKALNDEGIDVHFYFSIMDWSNPDYRSAIKSKDDSLHFEKFKKFTEAQLKELCTRYPSVKDFWFDGTWDASIARSNGAWTARLEQLLKEWVPGVTVNSRLRADEYGKRHFDSNGHLMGDYESGYERRLPDPRKDFVVTTRDWEACMTLPENQWGYHKDWSLSYVKNPVEVLERIVGAVAMGGNQVVNFGPQGDGDFRTEEKEMAQWIGKWMRSNGEAIYGCDYAGLPKMEWGFYTRKKDAVYMVVFNQPYSGHLLISTPKGTKVIGAETLDGTPLKAVQSTTNEYSVTCPSPTPGEPYVVRLKLEEKGQGGKQFREALT